MRRLGCRIALVVMLCLVGGAALAADDWTNQLRFGVGYFAPTSDDSGTIAYALYPQYVLDNTKGSVDSAVGVYVAFEHKFNQLLGLEGSISYFAPDFEFELVDPAGNQKFTGDGKLIPIAVALNFHLLKNSKNDLYLGPVIAYMMYDDVEMTIFETDKLKFEFDDEVAYGLQLGYDIPLAEKWAISFRGSYLLADAEPDKVTYSSTAIPDVPPPTGFTEEMLVTHGFKPNPLILSVMAGYRF